MTQKKRLDALKTRQKKTLALYKVQFLKKSRKTAKTVAFLIPLLFRWIVPLIKGKREL